MKRIILILIAVAMLATAAGCAAQVKAENNAAPAETQNPNVEAYGIVKATETRNIILDFQAPITAIKVKEGEQVKKDQLLVSLDMTEIVNQANNTELKLKAAENDMNRNLENTDLKKLQNDLRNADVIYKKDLKELSAKQKLYDTGSISLTELDSFKKLVENDEKSIADINYAIAGMKNNKGSQNDQKSIEAAVLEAELKLLKSRLGKPYIKGSDIVSDISNGLVYEIGYVPGDIAGPQKKLFSIMDLNSLIVEANVPEEFIKGVKSGADVTIIPTADKSRQYKGKVTYISGKAVRTNGETLIPVRISIDDRDDFLLPDFNVDVKIVAAE